MKCNFCDKKLRGDNKIGTCRKHRPLSESRKHYMTTYARENNKLIAEYKKVCHFTNLRPLWATENLRRKKNKLPRVIDTSSR